MKVPSCSGDMGHLIEMDEDHYGRVMVMLDGFWSTNVS